MDPPDLSIKGNDFMFNQEHYIQKVVTSLSSDLSRHYANIYIESFEKEALLKLHIFSW